MAGEIYEDIYIKSNNGESNLLTIVATSYQTIIVIVTKTGVTIDRGTNGDPFLHGAVTYTYSGSKKFIGISTSANATTPTYGIGSSFNISVTQSILSYYIVEEEKPKPTKTFDLSTLNLSAGTHEITVKARASGYADSPASNAVSYVVAGDTVQVSGTWRFNDIPNIASQYINEHCKFTTESGYSVTSIEISDSKTSIYRVSFNADGKSGYDINNGWDSGCQVITFDGTQYVSQEFYEWLVANAKRPISGTWVFNNTLDFSTIDESYTYMYYGANSLGTLSFSSKSTSYTTIGLSQSAPTSSYTTVYRNGSWTDTSYKTIVFNGTNYMTNRFYSFVELNATQK